MGAHLAAARQVTGGPLELPHAVTADQEEVATSTSSAPLIVTPAASQVTDLRIANGDLRTACFSTATDRQDVAHRPRGGQPDGAKGGPDPHGTAS